MSSQHSQFHNLKYLLKICQAYIYIRRTDYLFPMSSSYQTSVVSTPLPLPTHFSHAQQSFSLKKRKPPFSSSSSSSLSPLRPLSNSLPPRPPSKGCPPLSRVFLYHPTPWTPLSRSLIESPPPCSVYDPSRPQSFFSQCFTNLGLIGRGSFGEVFKVRNAKGLLGVSVEKYITILPIHTISAGWILFPERSNLSHHLFLPNISAFLHKIGLKNVK